MKAKAKDLRTAAVVRAVSATAVLASLAAFCGGVPLKNHNETFLRGVAR